MEIIELYLNYVLLATYLGFGAAAVFGVYYIFSGPKTKF